MKVAAMKDGSNKFMFGPEKFNSNEIQFARANGVVLNEPYLNATNEKYYGNSCGHCGTFLRKYYILPNYFEYAVNGTLPMHNFLMKYTIAGIARTKNI